MTHCWPASPPPKSRWIVGSATLTTVPSSTAIPDPMMHAASVTCLTWAVESFTPTNVRQARRSL